MRNKQQIIAASLPSNIDAEQQRNFREYKNYTRNVYQTRGGGAGRVGCRDDYSLQCKTSDN